MTKYNILQYKFYNNDIKINVQREAAMQPVQPGTGPLMAKDVCQNT